MAPLLWLRLLLLLGGATLASAAYRRMDIDILPALPSQRRPAADWRPVAQKIGLTMGAGAFSFFGFRFAHALLEQLRLRNAAAAKADGEPEVRDFKSEHEELWNAILAIHNTQADQKEALELMQKNRGQEVDRLAEVLAVIQTQLQQLAVDLEAVKTNLGAADLTQVEDMRAFQESLGEEVHRNAKEIDRMRDEHAQDMQRHQDLLLKKLSVFKEDLKKLVSRAPQT